MSKRNNGAAVIQEQIIKELNQRVAKKVHEAKQQTSRQVFGGVDEADESGNVDTMDAEGGDQVIERDFDPSVGGGVDRDKLKPEDFADPKNRAFPIVVPKDVHDAAKALNHDVKGNKVTIKKNIIKIAKAKGKKFEAQLPVAWSVTEDRHEDEDGDEESADYIASKKIQSDNVGGKHTHVMREADESGRPTATVKV